MSLNLKERLRQLGLAGLLVALFFFPQEAEAAGTVESVRTEVSSATHLPATVRARMETSVSVIAEQLLNGHKIEQVTGQKQEYSHIIHEVFDKVLVGYSVAKVEIEPGEQTLVRVELLPWLQRIEKVKLLVAVEGMPENIEKLVRGDLTGLQGVFEDSLSGLPIAAADWTNGVLKHSLNAYMEQHLPEFRADFDLEAADEAVVKVTVYPRLPVVRTAELFMRSDTVPNVFLLTERWRLQEMVNRLIGVPVGFIARHEQELVQEMANNLDEAAGFRRLKLKTKITFNGGRDMSVISHTDTDSYVLRLEGWADVKHGKNRQQNLRARLHAGVKTAKQDEMFVETDFFPEDVKWKWALGYKHSFGQATQTGLRYNASEKHFEVLAEQQLTHRLLLRYEYRWWDHRGEAALRYKLHDFLSLEYAVDKDDKWLRCIGYF